MKKVLICGILGKLGGYSKIKYTFEENTKGPYESLLAVEAIAKYYEDNGDDVSILLFVPESLITFVAENVEECIDLLVNTHELEGKFREKISENKLIEHKYDMAIIPSIGQYYRKENKNIIYTLSFKVPHYNLHAFLTTYLIKNFMNYDEVVVDISTGYNLYVTILLDSFRDYIVNRKLREIFSEDYKFKAKVSRVPPVLGNGGEVPLPIEFHEPELKVFFKFPLKRGILPDIGKIVKPYDSKFNEYISKIKNLKNYFSNYYRIFNSIFLNTPLVIMDGILDTSTPNNGFLNYVSELYYDIIKKIRDLRKMEINNSAITVNEEKTIDAKTVVNILHAAALSDALKKLYDDKIKDKKATVQNMWEIFREIYSKPMVNLKLNEMFLERDLCKIESYVEKIPEEGVCFADIIPKNSNEYKEKENERKRCSNEKRNFFAHSGLLSHFICVKKDKNEIYLKYKKDKTTLGKILGWIGE